MKLILQFKMDVNDSWSGTCCPKEEDIWFDANDARDALVRCVRTWPSLAHRIVLVEHGEIQMVVATYDPLLLWEVSL